MPAMTEAKETMAASVNAATRFLDALGRRDFEELEMLLAPNVWFRALLPRTLHESTNAGDALTALRGWFGGASDFSVLATDHHTLATRVFISYRFLLRPDWAPERWHIIEQVGFARVKEGRISRLDLVCTGFLPSDEHEPAYGGRGLEGGVGRRRRAGKNRWPVGRLMPTNVEENRNAR